MMEPVILALKQHYGTEVAIIVADLDHPETAELLEEYPVLYIPAFYFIDQDGVVRFEEAGALS